jgi:hypothetical protein
MDYSDAAIALMENRAMEKKLDGLGYFQVFWIFPLSA